MIDKLIPWTRKNGGLKVGHVDHPISRLRNDFNSLWDRFLDDWTTGADWNRMLGSRMELGDSEKEYVLRAELPGFEPENFDVKVSGNVLTLRAEHTEEGEEKEGRYRRYGSFLETFTLPQDVLKDEIDARYHSGVLEVHLPKSAECQGKRIEVKSA